MSDQTTNANHDELALKIYGKAFDSLTPGKQGTVDFLGAQVGRLQQSFTDREIPMSLNDVLDYISDAVVYAGFLINLKDIPSSIGAFSYVASRLEAFPEQNPIYNKDKSQAVNFPFGMNVSRATALIGDDVDTARSLEIGQERVVALGEVFNEQTRKERLSSLLRDVPAPSGRELLADPQADQHTREFFNHVEASLPHLEQSGLDAQDPITSISDHRNNILAEEKNGELVPPEDRSIPNLQTFEEFTRPAPSRVEEISALLETGTIDNIKRAINKMLALRGIPLSVELVPEDLRDAYNQVVNEFKATIEQNVAIGVAPQEIARTGFSQARGVPDQITERRQQLGMEEWKRVQAKAEKLNQEELAKQRAEVEELRKYSNAYSFVKDAINLSGKPVLEEDIGDLARAVANNPANAQAIVDHNLPSLQRRAEKEKFLKARTERQALLTAARAKRVGNLRDFDGAREFVQNQVNLAGLDVLDEDIDAIARAVALDPENAEAIVDSILASPELGRRARTEDFLTDPAAAIEGLLGTEQIRGLPPGFLDRVVGAIQTGRIQPKPGEEFADALLRQIGVQPSPLQTVLDRATREAATARGAAGRLVVEGGVWPVLGEPTPAPDPSQLIEEALDEFKAQRSAGVNIQDFASQIHPGQPPAFPAALQEILGAAGLEGPPGFPGAGIAQGPKLTGLSPLEIQQAAVQAAGDDVPFLSFIGKELKRLLEEFPGFARQRQQELEAGPRATARALQTEGQVFTATGEPAQPFSQQMASEFLSGAIYPAPEVSFGDFLQSQIPALTKSFELTPSFISGRQESVAAATAEQQRVREEAATAAEEKLQLALRGGRTYRTRVRV